MKIINLNKEQLNNFLRAQEHSSFLQSWEWGEFQEVCGNKVFRLGLEDAGKVVLAITLIKKVLPFGRTYFYMPRFHTLVNEQQMVFLFDEIKNLAKKENAVFLRFEPLEKYSISDMKYSVFKTIDIQPSKTVVLDLRKGEEEILKAMHQKTRYNIRLAERKGVRMLESNYGESDFKNFWKLMTDTEQRDAFRLHGKNYYQKMINGNLNLKNDLKIKLFFVELENEKIATGLFSFFGDTVTYLHGGSSNQYRNVMAPYLLQWHVIKLAKKEGYKYYDFYGIDEEKWPGVTRFKKGFSSEIIEYPGCFDIVFDKYWYSLYKLMRQVRRML